VRGIRAIRRFLDESGLEIRVAEPLFRVQQPLHNPEAIVIAVSVTHVGDIFSLKGDVEIKTDTIVLKADEASDVKVTPTSPLIPRGLPQFGIK
jgi:hypothetical protein